MKQQIQFDLNRKQILNSNVSLHRMVQSKIVKELREIAADKGLTYHAPEHADAATLRYECLQEERKITTARSRLVRNANKRRKKAKTPEEQETIDLELAASLATVGEHVPLIDPADVTYLYDTVTVLVTVCPPTKRHIDPPNLWPTVKPLLDGLTDASWWKDDDFNHVVETSFRYGGTSGKTGTYTLLLDIDPVHDTSEYVTTTDVRVPVGAAL